MGCFDRIIVKCPNCKTKHEIQSKSGLCLLDSYTLKDCPDDVLLDVNRHSPVKCKCGVLFKIDIFNRKAKIITDELSLD